jgi:site-specific DNA-methyltransferase (adenine-specific)
MKLTDKIEVFNEDCMNVMARYPDKYFELAIVDVPFGVSYARGRSGWGVCDNRPTLKDVKWDKETPKQEYFNELFRVSKNQIIWGANYLTDKLPVSKCWIVWNKIDNTNNKSVFSDAELAWTSFSKVVRMFTLRQMGFISDTNDSDRIHPTQKPTELYKWLLTHYAKQGDKILDTHLGSMSSLIACNDLGFEAVGSELDVDYFNAGVKRFKNHISQTVINF